jgi:5'-3' exonuclease
MPEVKRREIQRRRNQREKLWRDDDDEDNCGEDGPSGVGGGGALRRAAKKILVKQLKEWREKEAMMHKKKSQMKKADDKSGEGDASMDDVETLQGEFKVGTTKMPSNSGALAAGFTLEDGEDITFRSPQPLTPPMRHDNSSDDVISIDGSRGVDHKQSEVDRRQGADEDDNDQDYESENDWEMSHAIQSSINDSMNQRKRQPSSPARAAESNDGNSVSDEDDPDYENPYAERHDQFRHDADNDIIASLPSETRHQWIDSQYRAHRIQSRSECIQAAANPQDYSSTQLRNFLKHSMFNKRVGEIGKLIETRKEFGVEGDDPGDNGIVNCSRQNSRPGLQRLRRHNENASSNDDDDDEIFDTTSNDKDAPSMKVLFGDDDSDSDDNVVGEDDYDCDGGFLLPSTKVAVTARSETTRDDVIELLESDSEYDSAASRSSIKKSPSLNENERVDRNCNTTDHSDVPLPSNRTMIASHASKLLLELSTADQEWAEWGGDEWVGETDEIADTMKVDTNDFKGAVTKKGGSPLVLDDTESDSDDEHHCTTFPMLGNATKPARTTRDDEVEMSARSIVPITSGVVLPNKSDITEGDDDDVDVEWEDCNSEDNNENPSKDEDSNEREIEPCAIAPSFKPSEDEPLAIDSSSDSGSKNDEFDEILDDPQVAALKHAQATASNLTSWAGREFQRAISELTVHQTQPVLPTESSHQVDTAKEKIDLPSVHDEIDADRDSNDSDSTSGEEDELSGDTVYDSTDRNQDSSSAPHHIKKKPYLLDTSLEGLTEAHNAILEEEKTMERDMSTITDEMKEDILTLLQLCGIPWVESPTEAEAQCAALEELGLVDGIVTEDSDIFVFGGKKVYKNFFDEQKYVEAYYARDIERDLALQRHQLVALAMLLGGDYTDGVKGVGIVNGMEVLQAFTIHNSEDGIRDGLQRFREWLDGFGDSSLDDSENFSSHKVALFHKKHRSARIRWAAPADFPSRGIINAYLNPVVDKSKTKFSWAIPNLHGLQNFCADTLGWERAETDRVVNPVLKVLASGSKQMRLESYFLRYEDGYKFAKVRSKRLKSVLHDIQSGDNVDMAVASTADNDGMVESNTDEGSTPSNKRQRIKK